MKTIFEFCSAAFFQGDCLIMTCRRQCIGIIVPMLSSSTFRVFLKKSRLKMFYDLCILLGRLLKFPGFTRVDVSI